MIALLPAVGSPALAETSDPLSHLSASRLKSFLTCRLRFFYEKVLKLPCPTNPGAQVGKAVHEGLQLFHKAQWRGTELTRPALMEQYRAGYARLETESEVAYKDPGQRQESLEAGERLLQLYVDSSAAGDPRRIIGVEVWLRSEDRRLPLPLVGVLDLVRDGNVTVDFKTVASTPDPVDEAWQHQLQLTAYHLLVADATGEEPPPGELIFLVKTKSPKILTHTVPPVDGAQVDRFLRLADVYAHEVAAERYYPSPGMHCAWCPYQNRCAKWKGGLS
jgi:putative RecB family exonuclease